MTRLGFLTSVAIVASFALPSIARAVAVGGVANNVPYVMAFHPMNSSQHPYVGQLRLNFNNGIISGTYTDMSVRPGSPFANARNTPVTGTTSSSHLTLTIRHVTFRGTLTGEKMSGSATIKGTVFVFSAKQGTPGSGSR